MSVLTIASSKGGPGKTTVCMLLAGRLARDGLRVAMLDADPAQALMRWATHAYEGRRSLRLRPRPMRRGWRIWAMQGARRPMWCWWIPRGSATGRLPSP